MGWSGHIICHVLSIGLKLPKLYPNIDTFIQKLITKALEKKLQLKIMSISKDEYYDKNVITTELSKWNDYWNDDSEEWKTSFQFDSPYDEICIYLNLESEASTMAGGGDEDIHHIDNTSIDAETFLSDFITKQTFFESIIPEGIKVQVFSVPESYYYDY